LLGLDELIAEEETRNCLGATEASAYDPNQRLIGSSSRQEKDRHPLTFVRYLALPGRP